MSGLTNDDFRRIMATPRRLDPEQTPLHGSSSTTAGGNGPGTQARSGHQRGSRPSSRPSRVESLLPAGYRDRAQERRDREQVAVNSSHPDQNHINDKDHNDDDTALLAAESLPDHLTKYLGGDQDRTHLVRGLDYLLLERSRQEIQKQQEQRLEHAMAEAAKHNDQDEIGPARIQTDTPTLTFHTTMARRIYSSCMDKIGANTGDGRRQQRVHSIGAFQPGRTVYQFETDTFGTAMLPTVLHRSEEDCGSVQFLVETKLPDTTRNRLRDAMKSLREDRRPGPSATVASTAEKGSDQGPSSERLGGSFRFPDTFAQQQQQFPTKPVVDDSDDDIFADTGDYVCEPRAPSSLPTGPIRFLPDVAAEDDLVASPPGTGTVREAILQARSTAGQLGVYEKNLIPDNIDNDDDEEQADPVTSAQKEQDRSTIGKLRPLYDDYDEYTARIGYDSDDDDGPGNTAETKKLSATKISKAKSREKQKLNQQWQQISNMIDKKTTKRSSSNDNEHHERDDNPSGSSRIKRSRPI